MNKLFFDGFHAKIFGLVKMVTELELQYKAFKLLELRPQITQRELAKEMGMSLGKTHYVIKELISVGWVKLYNFRRSDNKMAYSYILTPEGLKEKSLVTLRFLDKKQIEYMQIKRDIALLKKEVNV